MSSILRQPVVVVLGHVDSGKTSLLDKIRGTAVQAREVGGITQHIGASYFPLATLQKICGPLLERVGGKVDLPGLLVIDTPGHEVFTNLRTRGGSAADIAILVVDNTRGFELQTYESIEILKARKVPFVVALNKLDLVPGWRSRTTLFVTESLKQQDKSVERVLDERIYNVVGSLSRLHFNAEAFYRVRDFAHEIAIVPVSARTGEGVAELLAVLVGLTQQYLRRRLLVTDGPARGIVLEVKEESGLGQTANVILIHGQLRTGDHVVLAKRDGTVVAKVRALLMPKPLDEMRDPRDRFTPVRQVVAAAGVKLATPDLEGVLAGSPLIGLDERGSQSEAEHQVHSEVQSLFIQTDRTGIVVKCDTLGSLEALVNLLQQRSILIRIADLGPVTRRDVIEAQTVRNSDPFLGVVLAFGVRLLPDAEVEAQTHGVRIFTDPIIYSLVEGYTNWVTTARSAEELAEFTRLTPACRFRSLPGLVFHRSAPAIFGVEVEVGRLRQKAQIINQQGELIGAVHQVQDQGKPIEEASQGSQVAVSVHDVTYGRQIRENETLYTLPSEAEARVLLTRFRHRLSEDEQKVLDTVVALRRKTVPLFAY